MFKLFNHSKGQEVEVTVSNQTILRVAGIIVGVILLLAAIRTASHALVLIFIAFFLALALNAPVHFIAQHIPGKRRGSRSLATTVSFLVVVIVLGAFLASIIPPLVSQTRDLIRKAPGIVRDSRNDNNELGHFVTKYHLEGQIDKFTKQLSERLDTVTSSAFSTISRIGSSAFSLLTILAITFMMLVEGPHWIRLGRDMVPHDQRPMAGRLARDMYKVVKGYINGQVTLAAIASLFILPALLILHISFPAALIVVVFICGLIPMIGHTLGAIIVTAVAAFSSPWHAVIILGYYILYQQIENYLIQPRVQANSTNMSPLLVFMSVVIGVSFSGLLGGLVAIPVAGCLRVVLLEYLKARGMLQDDTEAARTAAKATA